MDSPERSSRRSTAVTDNEALDSSDDGHSIVGEGPWHGITLEAVLEILDSSVAGLPEREAVERLQLYGVNELPMPSRLGAGELIWRQVWQPLVLVLVASAMVVVALGHVVDAAAILVLVIINTIVGAVQEARAERVVASLMQIAPRVCTVMRGGATCQIDADEIVPGDVLVLIAGDKVAADARIIETSGLFIDESMLTGESVPVEKMVQSVDASAAVADRRNIAHAGTLITAGRGRAVVVETGISTQVGRISQLIHSADQIETPLTRRIAEFSRSLTAAILLLGALTWFVAILRGHSMLDGILAAVALAVSAIPEGLPAIMTIALAVGVRRMADHNAIVRHMPSVESLGATTFICTDKTGTLTRGEMVATELYCGQHVHVSGSGFNPTGTFSLGGGMDARTHGHAWNDVERLLEAAVLCSDARLVQLGDDWHIEGDPTEGALVVAARKANLDLEQITSRYPRLDELPFDSDRRFMATLHSSDDGHLLIVKGAPEIILTMGDQASWGGRPCVQEGLLEIADAMATRGERVLAVASKRIAATGMQPCITHDLLCADFEVLGLVGLLDPPREEVVRSIASCHSAGIRVVMVTGDHPNTAAAIARAVGIADGDESAVVVGTQIDSLTDEQLVEAARSTPVFARVAPDHKIRLVRALQRSGEIVAMTGDGVNDAPALKQSDVGVAMGKNGTDVSRDAADIVLRDDNFATIEAAVREGRRVYDNIVKSIVFVLPTSAGEALLILVAIALGLQLPVLPIQILWINLVTTVMLDLALALEQPESDIMRRPPRRPDEPVLTPLARQRILLVSAFMFIHAIVVFKWILWQGGSLEQARTAVVATIVIGEAFYLLTCRSLTRSMRSVGIFTNPYIYLGIVGVIGLQIAFTHVSLLNVFFSSVPLSGVQWGIATLAAAVVLPLIAVDKLLRQRAARA